MNRSARSCIFSIFFSVLFIILYMLLEVIQYVYASYDMLLF